MTIKAYEPPPLEIRLTLALGLTVLSPYYRSFAQGLDLEGNERVLDFGSGSGICSRHIAALLHRGGGHLDCVDVSEGWISVIHKMLRRYDNVRYHLGYITELDLPEATYDAVVIHFVLHEIPAAGRSQVVSALARKLKPGGRLLLREPTGEGLELDELRKLALSAGLDPAALNVRKILIGTVIDACFTQASKVEGIRS